MIHLGDVDVPGDFGGVTDGGTAAELSSQYVKVVAAEGLAAASVNTTLKM